MSTNRRMFHKDEYVHDVDPDLNIDGTVDDQENALALHEERQRIENRDKREDAQRQVAWFALFGMLLYPFAVIVTVGFGLDEASKTLGDIAPTYFVSVAAIVAAFYTTQAYSNKKDDR